MEAEEEVVLWLVYGLRTADRGGERKRVGEGERERERERERGNIRKDSP
jgi:hypothetical protein